MALVAMLIIIGITIPLLFLVKSTGPERVAQGSAQGRIASGAYSRNGTSFGAPCVVFFF